MHARRGQTAAGATNARAAQRERLLVAAAARTNQLRWTPQLLELLLDELHVDEVYHSLFRGRRIPKTRYPQAVALALLSRHAWQSGEFAEAARKLGLLGRAGRGRHARHEGRPG